MNFDYQRLKEIQLTSAQRTEAAAALRRADEMADALIAATRSLRRCWHAITKSLRPTARAPQQANWAGRRARVGPSLDD